MKNHAHGAVEYARGQVPLTVNDIAQIPDIVTEPDYVAFGVKSRIGRDLVVYLKRMPDGTTLYLEEQRTGRRLLAMQSMRRYPATMDAASILRADHLNARSDGGDTLNIVDMTQNRQSKNEAVPLSLPDIYQL